MNTVLLGSLAMIPQFMQNMMGYDAYTSGLSMMPRGIGSLIGLLLNKYLQISQASIFIPNILFGIGMTIAMIPLVSFSCLTVDPKEMSNASGLQNFIKTIGGAIGTSLVATFISRFSQTHQFMLIKHLTETNDVCVAKLGAYTANFAQSMDLSTAGYMAQKLIYNELLQQSRLWAYIDSFRIYAVVSLGIILLIFLMKNSKSKVV